MIVHIIDPTQRIHLSFNSTDKGTPCMRCYKCLTGEEATINWKHNFKIIMDAVEGYARRWIKREVDQDPELSPCQTGLEQLGL